MVINPKVAKRFAEAMQSRTKIDAIDAALLAEFAHRMPFTRWPRPDALALAIRACARRIAALNKLRTQTKNQLHAAWQNAATSAIQLLGKRLVLPDNMSAKQWIAMAGPIHAAASTSSSTCPHSAPLAMILT